MDAVTVVVEEERATVTIEDYESVDAFLLEARERFQEGVDADRENRDQGLDDLRFLTGEGQWDDNVRKARENKGRPCLTINDLPQYIGQVIGDTRSNRPSIKVRPVEDADQELADVRAGLIRSIENLSNATQVYSLAGEDQVACGLGHFRVALEYACDDNFDQDIRVRHIPNPFGVVWDPLSTDPTGEDARFCFVVDEMDRATFEATYPDAETTELTIPLAEGDWQSKDSMRVTEYWMMRETVRTVALLHPMPEAEPGAEPVNAEPRIVDITGREEQAAPFIVKGPDGKPRSREVRRKSARMYLISGKAVLDGPYDYPISRLPIFKVTGREIRVAEKRYRFGLIRFAKDPIRMKNLWRSSAAEFLALAPKQQWLLHADNAEQANHYRAAHKSGDTVLMYTSQIPPQRIDPPSAPNALLQEAQISAQDIKDVTGLHDASLGMKSNETSGKAIMARERQGDVATFMYHDNLNASIRECGRVINELIPVVYDTARTIRVLGQDEQAKIMRVNDPNDPNSVDITRGKYDIVVETGPSYSTKRVEAADSMMAFVQAVPVAGQVAGDLIAKAQDWPMADEIAERLKRSLPPQITADEEEGGEPRQPSAAEQQMMQQQAQQAQMAQQAMQMEMAGKAAEVRLKEAQALKTMAEAQSAGMSPQGQPDQLDIAMKAAQLRKAEADADRAEAEAAKARAEALEADMRAKIDALGGPGAAEAVKTANVAAAQPEQRAE